LDHKLLILAMPILVSIALIEAVLYPRLAGRRYPWAEAMGSLGVALGQMIVRVLAGGLALGWFFWLHSVTPLRIALDGPIAILSLFLAVEFVYYWHHRLSHEIRWLWATHSVHHSANHLNFFAALRLGWTGEISGAALLFAPVVLIGFHPLALLAMLAINLLYQFFVHNDYIGKLGPLEHILNTPSNHRVHHGSNEAYLDRNYGGILIVFDRLFGTYTEEREDDPPRFGLVEPIATSNPFRIALHEWAAIARDLKLARGWRERWLVLFGRPGWRPKAARRIALPPAQPRPMGAPGDTSGAAR
jgi:sterol desaturase/sphingolipid hydroxylase (fatty acid hydroxylase superfamily)